MIRLLSNWKILAGGFGVLVVIVLLFHVKHTYDRKAELEIELAKSQDDLEACKKVHEQERAASEEYQGKIHNLNSQLAKYRSVQNRCVPVSPPNTGSGAAASGSVFSGGNGLESGYLIDFAGRCEETRLRLIGCQRLSQ